MCLCKRLDVYKNHVPRNVRSDLVCYAVLGVFESLRVRHPKDWKIATLQFNKVEFEKDLIPKKRRQRSENGYDFSQRNR